MQLALREIARYRVPLLIWLMVSIVAAVAGPFGTLDAMGFLGRLLYWGGVAGGSILLNYGTRYAARDMGLKGRILVAAGFVLLVSTLAHAVNSILFPVWGGVADWLYLTGTVGLVTAAVQLVVWVVVPKEAASTVDENVFMRRLPIEVRGPLVRIEAQDHYLNVVTARGQAMILMRLGDAKAELEGLGLQVHRSHWIAPDAVRKHSRIGGRDMLTMADEMQVPVSRSFRAAAQDAGLF